MYKSNIASLGGTFDPPESGMPSSPDEAAAFLVAIEGDDEFDAYWALFEQIFPHDESISLARIRRLIRAKSYAKAIELIDGHAFNEDIDPLALQTKADLLYDAREFDRSHAAHCQLIGHFPERRDITVNYAKRLVADGFLTRAFDLLQPLEGTFAAGSKSEALWIKTCSTFELLCELEQRRLADDEDARLMAMKHAILWFADRDVPAASAPGLGRLSLITGSLGPGGAERQLTRVAIELERARKAGRTIADHELSRPVEIIVRSHGPEKQNDFYLREVQAGGVELVQLNEATPVSSRVLGVEDETLKLLLDYLPPSVNYGVKRLSQHLVNSKTDTASAWQDGACLFAGLAALVAGVPHIQLAIRGLPPILRKHMFRPEYEVMYRAMAQIPGVTFLSNNRASARAYSEWLDIPVDRFAIVYNGVEPMQVRGTEECERKWAGFLAATSDATHTIGSVFRFDTDKQPNLWIRFAARYLKAHPKTRIVMVGGGRLLPGAIKLAEDLGIADRILFTDRSSTVGYWVAKMDVFLLLSRYEGLPNVLIEAQYMGVRVVTTPAGGASECLINGTTGYVLECCEQPCLDNLVMRAHELANRAGDRSLFALDGAGRRFLDENFSIPQMLKSFVSCTASPCASEADQLQSQAA